MVETVAVDWEKIGPGPIGAEIATLTFGTLRRCEFDVARADEIDAAVFDGYVAGLREAGWHGAVEPVRLGYTAAIALRWRVLAGILHMLVHGADRCGPRKGRFFRRRWCLCSAYAWRSSCSIGPMRPGGCARAGADRTMRSA